MQGLLLNQYMNYYMYIEKKLTVSHDDTTKKEGDLGLNLTDEIPSVGGCSSWNSFGPSAILQKCARFLC